MVSVPYLAEAQTLFVTTPDGVRLNVSVTGSAKPSVTLILIHGWTLTLGTWARQLPALTEVEGLRVITYDHRGHGGSDTAPRGTATIAQMGEDLITVITQLSPRGPIVLAGHSLGGMTIMALAQTHPELFGKRIVGVGLFNTSGGGPKGVASGIPLGRTRSGQKIAAKALAYDAKAQQKALQSPRSKTRTKRSLTPRDRFMRWLLTGPKPDAAVVSESFAMLKQTPPASFPAFFHTFLDHNRLSALSALADIPVVIMTGAKDRLTLPSESEALAKVLPSSRLTIVPMAGHMLPLERADVVTQALKDLLPS